MNIGSHVYDIYIYNIHIIYVYYNYLHGMILKNLICDFRGVRCGMCCCFPEQPGEENRSESHEMQHQDPKKQKEHVLILGTEPASELYSCTMIFQPFAFFFIFYPLDVSAQRQGDYQLLGSSQQKVNPDFCHLPKSQKKP